MARPVIVRVLAGVMLALIVRVLVGILWNYPDYFPANFTADFLLGRESIFHGWYRAAFYAHIVSGPLALVSGLVLTSATLRKRWPAVHRGLGKVQLAILLPALLLSGTLMSRHAFGGMGAGLAFLALAGATGACALMGFLRIRERDFSRHGQWMMRCQVLITSALVLRLLSGSAELAGVTDSENAYILAAWASWLVPLAIFEGLRVALPRKLNF